MLALFAAFIVILIVVLCLPVIGIFTLAGLRGSGIEGGFVADKEIYEYTKQEIQAELDNLKKENEAISAILEANDAEFPAPLDAMSYEDLNVQLEELLSVANMDFMPKGLLTKLVQTINTRISVSEEIFNHIKTKNDWRPNKNLYNYEYIKAVKSNDKHFMMFGVKEKIFNEELLLSAKMPMLVRKELSILETDFKLSEDTRRALRLLFCMIPHKQYITENSECNREYIDKMMLTSRSFEIKKGIYDACLKFLDEYIVSTIHDYPTLQDVNCHAITQKAGSGPRKVVTKAAVPKQPAKPAVKASPKAAAQKPASSTASASAVIESNAQSPLVKFAHKMNDESNETVVKHRNYYVKRPVVNILSRDPEDDSLEKNGYSDFRDNKYFKLVTNINDIHLRFLAFYISNRKRIDELLSLDEKCIDRLSDAGEKIRSMKEEIVELTKLKEQVEILKRVEENAKKTLGEKYELEAELNKLKEGNVFILEQKIQKVESEHALLMKDYESLLDESKESKNDSLRSAKLAADLKTKLENMERSLLEISSRRRELEEELTANQKKMTKLEEQLEDVKADNKYWQEKTLEAQIEAKGVINAIPKFKGHRSDVSKIVRQINSLTEKLNAKISKYSSEQENIGSAVSKNTSSLGEKIKQLGIISARVDTLASINAKVKAESNEKITELQSKMEQLKPFFISNGFSFEYLAQHISNLETERAMIIKKMTPLNKANAVDRLKSFDRLEYINRELYSQAKIIERYNQFIAGNLGYSQNETKLNYSDPTFRNEYKFLLNEYKSYSTKFQRNEEMNVLLRSKNKLLNEKVAELQSQNKALALVSGDELTVTLKRELTKAADEIEKLRNEKPEQDLAEYEIKLAESMASNEKLKSEINDLETQLRSTNEKHTRELASAVDSYSSELDEELNEMLKIFEIVGNWPANSVGYADVKKKQLAVLEQIKKVKTSLNELERLNVSNERIIAAQKSEIEQNQKDIVSKDLVIQELRQLSGQITGVKEVSTLSEQLTKENEQLKNTEEQLSRRVSSLQESLKDASVKCNSDLISKLSAYVSKVSGTRSLDERNEIIKLLGPTAVKYGTLSLIIFENFNKDKTPKITGRYDFDDDDLDLEVFEEEDDKPKESDYWDEEEYQEDLNKWTLRNTPASPEPTPANADEQSFETMGDSQDFAEPPVENIITEERLLEFVKQKLAGEEVDALIDGIYGDMIDTCFSIAYYNIWHIQGRTRDLFATSITDAMRYSMFVKMEPTNEQLSSKVDTLEQDSLILGILESTDKLTQAYQDLYKLQQRIASIRDSTERSLEKIVSMIDSNKTFIGRLKQLVGITENISRSDLIKKLEDSINKIPECDDSEIKALVKVVRKQVDGIEELLSVNDKKINTMITTVNETMKKIETLRSYKQKYDDANLLLQEANQKVESLEQSLSSSNVNVEVNQRLALAKDTVVSIEKTIETLKSDYADKAKLTNREIETLKAKNAELEKMIEYSEKTLTESELTALRSQKAELLDKLSSAERRLGELREEPIKEVVTLKHNKSKLEKIIAKSGESDELRLQMSNIDQSLKDAEKRLEEFNENENKELEILRAQLSDIDNQILIAERKISEANNLLSGELDTLRSQKTELERRLSEASVMSNEEVDTLKSQKTELERRLAEASAMSNEEVDTLRSQKTELERRLAEAEQQFAESELSRSSTESELVTKLREQIAELIELDKTNKSNETNMINSVIRKSFEVINVNNNSVESVQEIIKVIDIIDSRWQANKVTLKEYLDISEDLKSKLAESVKNVSSLEAQLEDLRKTQYDLESYKTAYRILTNDKLLLDRIEESDVTSAVEEKKLFVLDIKQKIENAKSKVDTFDITTVSSKIENLKQEMLAKEKSLKSILNERKPIADLLESYERDVLELALTVGNLNDKINSDNLGLCKQLRNDLTLSIQKTEELNLVISSFETKMQPTIENLKRMTSSVNSLSEIVGTMKENLLRHVDKDLESAILLGNSSLQDRLDFIKKIKSQSETVYVDVPYYITVKEPASSKTSRKPKESQKPTSETMNRLLYRNH